MESLWDQTLAELRSSLSIQDFTAWIACLRTSAAPGDALTVEAPSVFHRNWVQQHFLDRIRSTATHVAGHPVAVSVSVGAGIAMPDPVGAAITRAGHPKERDSRASEFQLRDLRRRATATSWRMPVRGPSRRIRAAPTIRSSSTAASGLGKTHLVHAIANAVRQRFRSYRVLSIGAELFINEMVSAVRRQQMETFHQRFRKIDTLVVDDVQFIAGKERTQEEFLHTFNLLCAAGKQIVLSSDKAPREIAEPRDRAPQSVRGRVDGRGDATRSRDAPPDTGGEGAAAGSGGLGRGARLSDRARPSGERARARRGAHALEGHGVARRSDDRPGARRGDHRATLSRDPRAGAGRARRVSGDRGPRRGASGARCPPSETPAWSSHGK